MVQATEKIIWSLIIYDALNVTQKVLAMFILKSTDSTETGCVFHFPLTVQMHVSG